MDILEERHKPLTKEPPHAEHPEDLASFDRDLEKSRTRAEILHSVLTENPTNTQRSEPPFLIDSEEIGVLKQHVHTTDLNEEDMTALTAHPRK